MNVAAKWNIAFNVLSSIVGFGVLSVERVRKMCMLQWCSLALCICFSLWTCGMHLLFEHSYSCVYIYLYIPVYIRYVSQCFQIDFNMHMFIELTMWYVRFGIRIWWIVSSMNVSTVSMFCCRSFGSCCLVNKFVLSGHMIVSFSCGHGAWLARIIDDFVSQR